MRRPKRRGERAREGTTKFRNSPKARGYSSAPRRLGRVRLKRGRSSAPTLPHPFALATPPSARAVPGPRPSCFVHLPVGYRPKPPPLVLRLAPVLGSSSFPQVRRWPGLWRAGSGEALAGCWYDEHLFPRPHPTPGPSLRGFQVRDSTDLGPCSDSGAHLPPLYHSAVNRLRTE